VTKTPAGSELLSAHRQDGVIHVEQRVVRGRRTRSPVAFPATQRSSARESNGCKNCISGHHGSPIKSSARSSCQDLLEATYVTALVPGKEIVLGTSTDIRFPEGHGRWFSRFRRPVGLYPCPTGAAETIDAEGYGNVPGGRATSHRAPAGRI